VKSYKVVVNGRPETIRASGDTPLLWILRESLGLTGTKFGCGIAECGACTVHLDGRPIRSCVTPIAAIGTSRIITIEHLARLPGGESLQRAWVDEDVPQCGYCQSGMIMEAHALLAEHPQPTDRQIEQGMDGHICRCGTYARIRRAIKRASERDTPAR
jgi:isoquinoline 1-oxidoreductase alpha subunit